MASFSSQVSTPSLHNRKVVLLASTLSFRHSGESLVQFCYKAACTERVSIQVTFSILIMLLSDDDVQDLDITKNKKLDRKRRDLSSSLSTDKNDKEKTEIEPEEESKKIEKRSNSGEEKVPSSLDDISDSSEGSENSDDVKRRTRQLRPSIISSPWRVSSGASFRSIDFSPTGFESNLNNFPSSQSGLLYKSEGRFYPTNNFKASEEFNPVISTYSGGSNKNKYSVQSFNSYSGESGERSQEATPKYKQSSKIPSHSHSSSLFPLLFSLDSFETKSKATTTEPPHSQDNYSYFHFGKPSSQLQQKPDKVKTYAFPVTNSPSTTRNPFASFNSVGGFFNNNQHLSNQGYPSLKPISKNVTPAPIYEGAKSASSYDSRYTTAKPIKATPSTPYPSNPFLNNLAFGNQSPSFYSFGLDKPKEDEKVVQITTKKPTFTQYPIPSSTPKYIQSYTTPNQLFDFDKFVAGIRETQRLQNGQKFSGINHFYPTKNKTQSSDINQNVRYQQVFTTSSTTTSTASPDDYYYEDDEEEESPADFDENISKYKAQSVKPSINSYNRKPVVNSNLASNDEDFYYDDEDEEVEEEEEFQPRPPPVNKPKYTPMTETMAPRPINVTTLRPYYVSGQTFTSPSPPTSTSSMIPSIIKFPDDVFQAIRPFASPAPNLINSHKSHVKPSKNNDIMKSTTTTTTTTTTQRTSTKRTKVKLLTKPTTKKSNNLQATSSTTVKPTRLTTRRKTYTIRPNRGNMKFKVSTKRPDLTRLEIDDDEKLPNR